MICEPLPRSRTITKRRCGQWKRIHGFYSNTEHEGYRTRFRGSKEGTYESHQNGSIRGDYVVLEHVLSPFVE